MSESATLNHTLIVMGCLTGTIEAMNTKKYCVTEMAFRKANTPRTFNAMAAISCFFI